jgi:hypothetical protein
VVKHLWRVTIYLQRRAPGGLAACKIDERVVGDRDQSMKTLLGEHARGSRLSFDTLERLEASLRVREHALERREALAAARDAALITSEVNLHGRSAALDLRARAQDQRLEAAFVTLGRDLRQRHRENSTRETLLDRRGADLVAQDKAFGVRVGEVVALEESGKARLERELLIHQLQETNERLLVALAEAREKASRAEIGVPSERRDHDRGR